MSKRPKARDFDSMEEMEAAEQAYMDELEAERDRYKASLRFVRNTPPADLTSIVKRPDDWWYRIVMAMRAIADAALEDTHE